MFQQKSWLTPAALISISFLGVSAANAQSTKCYTISSLQGSYAMIGNYGSNIAMALATEYFDGSGNLTRNAIVNQPLAGSTTGERTLTSTISKGTYTVNCDGTGVLTRVLTNVTTGAVLTVVSDLLITGAVVQGGQFLATTIVDAQRTPSTIVAGGVFVTFVHTRLPDFGPLQN